MAIPQLRRFTTPNGYQGVSNMPETVNPNANVPKLGGGTTPQQRYAIQQQQMSGNPQLDAELASAAQNKAQNLAMFGGGYPQLAGRSQEMQLAIDKANSQIAGGSGFDIKYGQKQLDTLLGNEAAQQQNAINQQGNMLDLQKSRESNQFDQNKNFVDLITRQAELDQNRAFEREMLGAKSGLEQKQLTDKFGMDIALKKMELENKANQPLNEYQQARVEDLKFRQEEKTKEKELAKAEKEASLYQSMGAMQAQMERIKRAKALQDATETGVLAGSDAGKMLRRAAPGDVLGGESVNELDKLYKDMVMQQLMAYKAGGVTFGALSEGERKFIENATLDTTGDRDVNLRALNTLEQDLQRRIGETTDRAARLGLDINPYIDKNKQTEQGQQGKTQTVEDILKLYGN